MSRIRILPLLTLPPFTAHWEAGRPPNTSAIKHCSSETQFLSSHPAPTFTIFGEGQALACDVEWCLVPWAPSIVTSMFILNKSYSFSFQWSCRTKCPWARSKLQLPYLRVDVNQNDLNRYKSSAAPKERHLNQKSRSPFLKANISTESETFHRGSGSLQHVNWRC